MQQLPSIKILSGPTPTEQGTFDAGTEGLSSLYSVGSEAVDLIPFQNEDLLVFLNNRAAIAKTAKGRSGNMFGRLYNRFSGDDPDYVELSGVHLKQTFSVIDRPVPSIIVAHGKYKLRADIIEEAIDRLRKST